MNKSIKEIIREAEVGPDPLRKDRFIRKYRYPGSERKSSGIEILLHQARYIRVRIWILSVLLLVLSLIWLRREDWNTIRFIAAAMPFISGFGIIESFRSDFYSMNEMEGATKLSVKGACLARIACIGFVHIILIICLSLAAGRRSGYGFLLTGAFITIPYLTSSIIGMEIERTAFGRKSPWIYPGVSAAVAFITLLILRQKPSITIGGLSLALVCMAEVVLLIIELYEIRRMTRWEEYAWS